MHDINSKIGIRICINVCKNNKIPLLILTLNTCSRGDIHVHTYTKCDLPTYVNLLLRQGPTHGNFKVKTPPYVNDFQPLSYNSMMIGHLFVFTSLKKHPIFPPKNYPNLIEIREDPFEPKINRQVKEAFRVG